MLAAVKAAIIAYLGELRSGGGALEGIKTIISGPVDPGSIPLSLHPALVVSFADGDMHLVAGRTGLSPEANFALQLYTASADRYGEAEDACLRLLWSDDGTKGIYMALVGKQGFTASGQLWGVRPAGKVQFRYGRGAQDCFTFAAQINVVAKTMM